MIIAYISQLNKRSCRGNYLSITYTN